MALRLSAAIPKKSWRMKITFSAYRIICRWMPRRHCYARGLRCSHHSGIGEPAPARKWRSSASAGLAIWASSWRMRLARKSPSLANRSRNRPTASAWGADHFYATSDPATFAKLKGSLDLIICTVSTGIDWNQYIDLLKVDGTMVIVGVPDKAIPVAGLSLIMGRRSLAGSVIGGIPETQEMLNFCGKHGITSDIELIPIQKVNEAYDRVMKSDVRYRFVIDIASLNAS